MDRTRQRGKSKNMKLVDSVGMVMGFGILALASVLASLFTFHQLGGYDLSPLIDLHWRFRNNEIPGQDFINTLPPILLIAAKAIASADLGWFELTATSIISTFLAFILILFVSGIARCTVYWAAGCAFILALPLVYTNHVWHSSLSQLSAIVFFYSIFLSLETGEWNRRFDIGIFLSSALLVMSKQNVALPILTATLLFVCVFGGKARIRLAALILLGIVAGISLGLLYLGYTFAGFIQSYLAVAGRGLPGLEMYFALKRVETHYPLLYLTIGLVFLIILSWERCSYASQRVTLLCALFGLLSLIPILTDWDTKMNNAPLPLFVAWAHLMQRSDRIEPPQGETQPFLRGQYIPMVSLLFCLAYFAIAVHGGAMRERMMHVGPLAFYETPDDKVVKSGYFSGLHTGAHLDRTLTEMDRVKSAYANAHFFFGPRIEFGYQQIKTPSPKHMPLWWHPGTSFAIEDKQRVMEAFLENHFDVLVFLKDDRTRMPVRLIQHIAREYDRSEGFEALDVYVRKQ
jgi:hypothetical protein